jgi:hypothetical protein
MAQAYRRVAILESSISRLRESVVFPSKLLVCGKFAFLQIRKMRLTALFQKLRKEQEKLKELVTIVGGTVSPLHINLVPCLTGPLEAE